MRTITWLGALLIASAMASSGGEPSKACKPSMGGLFSSAVPIYSLDGRVTPDGKHVFTFTMQWNTKQLDRLCLRTDGERNEFIEDAISRELSRQQLCPSGWKFISREITEMKPHTVLIEGQCH